LISSAHELAPHSRSQLARLFSASIRVRRHIESCLAVCVIGCGVEIHTGGKESLGRPPLTPAACLEGTLRPAPLWLAPGRPRANLRTGGASGGPRRARGVNGVRLAEPGAGRRANGRNRWRYRVAWTTRNRCSGMPHLVLGTVFCGAEAPERRTACPDTGGSNTRR